MSEDGDQPLKPADTRHITDSGAVSSLTGGVCVCVRARVCRQL